MWRAGGRALLCLRAFPWLGLAWLGLAATWLLHGGHPDRLPPSVLPLQPSVREYALSRALQLDPKCVPALVALARLYAGGQGQGESLQGGCVHAAGDEGPIGSGPLALAGGLAGECRGGQTEKTGCDGVRPTTPAGSLGPPQSTARAGPRQRRCSTRAATSPRSPPSGRQWPTSPR